MRSVARQDRFQYPAVRTNGQTTNHLRASFPRSGEIVDPRPLCGTIRDCDLRSRPSQRLLPAKAGHCLWIARLEVRSADNPSTRVGLRGRVVSPDGPAVSPDPRVSAGYHELAPSYSA